MSGRKSSTFTEVELEFMQIIWDLKEVTTERMRVALSENDRNLPDGAIRKILSILMKKGHLKRISNGRGFIYSANIHEKQAKEKIILDLLVRAFNNSIFNMFVVIFDSCKPNKSEIQKIKKIISEHKKN